VIVLENPHVLHLYKVPRGTFFNYIVSVYLIGNKCAGGSVLSPQGLVVHDSHAEQLARRGFIRFVQEFIENIFDFFFFP